VFFDVGNDMDTAASTNSFDRETIPTGIRRWARRLHRLRQTLR
jgi:hypothetical protein